MQLRKLPLLNQNFCASKIKMETKKLLFERMSGTVEHSGHTKVTVVGVGQVGMACAYHLVATVRPPRFSEKPATLESDAHLGVGCWVCCVFTGHGE